MLDLEIPRHILPVELGCAGMDRRAIRGAHTSSECMHHPGRSCITGCDRTFHNVLHITSLRILSDPHSCDISYLKKRCPTFPGKGDIFRNIHKTYSQDTLRRGH